jgi:pyridoxamine 5'-phosphate oxidase
VKSPAKPLRSLLRELPSLAGPLPSFDPEGAPSDPAVLFTDWLHDAIEAGVVEPHAMTLSTVDPRGHPSARVLILKDLDAAGWQFASSASSRKGKELANAPWASLTFYWAALGRQVRVRGAVAPVSADASARDFLSRSPGARAVALGTRQSERLGSRQELEEELARAASRIGADPEAISAEWTLYAMDADEVEFWQADPERRHTRLSYTRSDGGWTRGLLWP